MSQRTFADDEQLLSTVLEEVVRAGEGDAAMDLHARAVELARRSRAGEDGAADELAGLVGGLGLDEMQVLVRSLTRLFQLINLVEDNDRIRRLRRRLADGGPDRQAGSVRDTIRRLAANGTSAEDLGTMLAGAELELVMTAHPTEARRRTTIDKLARIFRILRDLDERLPLPGDEAQARERLAAVVQELWASDEVRAVSPKVADEVQSALAYFATTLSDVVPAFYRELDHAVAAAYPGADVTVPPLLTFGSWMGGDRDGNPFVTPQVTREALEHMRATCLRFLQERAHDLAARLSLSDRITGKAIELDPLLAAATEDFPELAADVGRRNPEEPFRRALAFVSHRVRATRKGEETGYAGPAALLADLGEVDAALQRAHASFVASADLRDLIRQVEVFGFHFARLDVREHAKIHRHAIAEILATLGVHDDYAGLDQTARVEVLAELIADRRPLIPGDVSGFSDSTQEAVETFVTLRALLAGEHAGAVRTYVVSGTEGPADLLEVLLLMKESRLSGAGGEDAQLRIAPLFEAGETLAGAAQTMAAVLDQPVYRTALRAAGDDQEVMIGYSDSNKDVGYVASGWATYRAQAELAATFRERGVRWTFFHGRGGAVGRGGGRANVAINSQPPGTVAGRLKMTEQGEVLSAKYSVREIAERELELTASAALSSSLDLLPPPDPDRLEVFRAVLEEMASTSAAAYRALVHGDDGFIEFFKAATPLEEITRLQLGSRPAKRSDAPGIDDLRAIPWVFAWTQARVVLPAWYGLGTALTEAIDAHGLDCLREMRRDWPFFAALLSNAEMACAKADIGIGRRYAELCRNEAVRTRVWSSVEDEFSRTVDGLVRVVGGDRLLDKEPVLRDSIDRRNPFVDPLSYIQIELLRRARAGTEAGDGNAAGSDLPRLSAMTINGIASGLRNTG